jgi:hypothetical protein
MKHDNTSSKDPDPDMEPEYDFSGGVRGKYFERFKKMRLKVAIDPDVARTFPTSLAVNEALRTLQRIAKTRSSPKAPVRRRKAG